MIPRPDRRVNIDPHTIVSVVDVAKYFNVSPITIKKWALYNKDWKGYLYKKCEKEGQGSFPQNYFFLHNIIKINEGTFPQKNKKPTKVDPDIDDLNFHAKEALRTAIINLHKDKDTLQTENDRLKNALLASQTAQQEFQVLTDQELKINNQLMLKALAIVKEFKAELTGKEETDKEGDSP